ncbi:MAG TPA: hypothetical protein VJB08_00525 [Candidatus Nanoarchaeia archaeon]|nr:hypothetical protein [Candidatus Nanoarchaeia archaeon]
MDIQRDLKFKSIEKAYNDRFLQLVKSGKYPWKSTEKGFWGCSILAEVYELFEKIGLDSYASFVDLGSGDGRVVLVASLFTKAWGIEIDDELIEVSNALKEKVRCPNAEFKKTDFFDVDLSAYAVLFLFPDKPLAALEDKIRGAKNKLILYGPHFHPLKMRLKRLVYLDTNNASVYEA